MKKFTFWLYVNGVHCQDYAVTAKTEDEAKRKLRQATYFEQFYLANVENI